MWDMIAHKTLGSITLTDKLMMANRQYLGFYTFPAGIVLTLPEVGNESNLEGLPFSSSIRQTKKTKAWENYSLSGIVVAFRAPYLVSFFHEDSSPFGRYLDLW